MRILEAFGEPIADGGQEAFVFGVMDRMDMSGMTVDCLTAYDCRSERYRALVERGGGRVFALNLPFAPGKSRGNIRRPFRAFLRENRYDVVHVHSGSISVLAIMAAEADQAGVKKVIVHSHSAGERDSAKHRLLRRLASLSMRRHVDLYCACSGVAASWKFEPRYAGKAIIIKNGIDTDRFRFDPRRRHELRQSLGLEGLTVGHVGRFTDEKNHAFLLEVFEEIARTDASARLLLVGDGPNRAGIMALAREKKLGDRVIFTGSVSNVSDYLQAMDVFVMPSLFEGMPIVGIEAQAAGLPVLSSDRVSTEVNVSGDVVFMALEKSPAVWAEACLKLSGRERVDRAAEIRGAGYDSRQTAETIRDLYIR